MIPNSQRRAQSISIPSPTGGWDTRSTLSNMPVTNAVKLENWFPDTDNCAIRGGHASHATGLGAAVETILEYNKVDGTNEIFGCAGGNIYDVGSVGAVGAAVASSKTNARWQQVQFGTSGGQFLIAVNGADTPITYNGTTWSTATFTGPTVANLIWITRHQRRLWFGEKDSLSLWYLATNAITGAATEFPLAGYFSRGGYIMACESWTRDGGDGMDDFLCIVSSEGECAVFQGTDPSSDTTWSLVGVFRIGRPIGRRCMIKSGGDLIVITEQGFVPMSTILGVDESMSENVGISSQINTAVNDEVRTNSSLWGWEAILYPKGKQLIFNIPQSTTTSEQFVFNTLTGAPCKYTGINALCWGLMGDRIFLGKSDGKVYEFDTNEAGDDGADIVADAIIAFTHFGARGQNKVFKRVEVVIDVTASPGGDFDPAIDLWTDYQIGTASGAAIVLVASHGKVKRGWRGVEGVGRSASVQVRLSTEYGLNSRWLETSIVYVPGGLI